MVQEKVLEKIDSRKLKAFVVWTPRYPGDSRTKALSSMKLVNDKRAVHFWDGSGQLGKHYGKTLALPAKQRFAWDVYFVFDGKAALRLQKRSVLHFLNQAIDAHRSGLQGPALVLER